MAIKNEHEIVGDEIHVYANYKGGKVMFRVSLSKREKMEAFPLRWFLAGHEYDKTLYVYGHVPGDKSRTMKLHRYLLDVIDPKIKVDHEDHDGLNNTDQNIRATTGRGNQLNRRGAASTNTHGHFGVVRSESGKWLARSAKTVNGKTRLVHFGTFANPEDAVEAARLGRERMAREEGLL